MYPPMHSLVHLSLPTHPSGMPLTPAPLPSPFPLQDGYTPLLFAANDGYVETVRLLIDRGADIEGKTNVRRKGRGIGWEIYSGNMR